MTPVSFSGLLVVSKKIGIVYYLDRCGGKKFPKKGGILRKDAHGVPVHPPCAQRIRKTPRIMMAAPASRSRMFCSPNHHAP